jgi:uncharacterized protein (TIGR04141 family)
VPSITLYRIPDADLSDDCVSAILSLEGAQISEISTTGEVRCRLLIFRDAPEQPEWVSYVEALASQRLGIPARESVGAILLLQPHARRRVIYAATWGSGRFFLRSERLQPDWGLRCALNLISGLKADDPSWDPARVRALRSKRVSQNTLIAEIQSSRKTTIDSFPFSADVDQLRRVTGTPTNSSRFGSTISGGVSIHLKRPDEAKNLINLCREIEQAHGSTDYQRHFGWIDNVSSITDQKTVAKVYEQIIADLRGGALQDFNLSPPTLVPWDEIAKFVYQWGNHKSDVLDDPSAESFHEFLAKHSLLGRLSADALRGEIKLHAMNDNSEKVQSWTIVKCLSGEFKIGTDSYILDDGALLYVARDYLQDLNKFTNEINNSALQFPTARRGEQEKNYNKRTSERLAGAILLDRRTVTRRQATAIEVCDVATKRKQLIHVKKGTSSSSLSHLFAQGVVSAELLHMDLDFRNEIGELLAAGSRRAARADKKISGSGAGKIVDFAWLHGNEFEPHACEVVYVVMTNRAAGMRKDELPFFSKINLRMRCHELRRMGFKYSLALVSL